MTPQLDDLERLSTLLDEGKVTSAEYELLKRRVLFAADEPASRAIVEGEIPGPGESQIVPAKKDLSDDQLADEGTDRSPKTKGPSIYRVAFWLGVASNISRWVVGALRLGHSRNLRVCPLGSAGAST